MSRQGDTAGPSLLPGQTGLLYGADYNPEQWPESVWDEDLRLMRDCGVNLVHVGIFAWARLNPKPGVFDFDWLDRVLDKLHAGGIAVGLATATASPPAWLGRLHPESRPVDAAGNPFRHGSRQNYTPNSAAYRRYAGELVEAIAIRYAGHPAVAEWHINNEYGCHVEGSFGEEDADAFRAWLRERYGSLDALNEAWGTTFWGQLFHEWDEVQPPMQTPAIPNPGIILDFRRFFSDALLECFRMEKAILRKHSPDLPITTNFIGQHPTLDQYRWAEDLDFAAWDSYPDPKDADAPYGWPIGHDITRSIKDAPFMLMEQVTSQVNWRPLNHLKKPGQMRLWSYQAIAHGADGVLFFQWRKSRFGAEKYHGALVGHTPPEQSQEYLESRELGRELQKLDCLQGSRVVSDTAVLYDWPTRWLLEAEAAPREFDYDAVVSRFHQSLLEAGVTSDVICPERDFSKYRLIVAPLAYMLSTDAAERLTRFVREGGTLVLGFFSGIVDESGRVQLGGYPGLLREAAGLWVERWEPIADGETVRWGEGAASECGSCFSEHLHVESAEVLARYQSGFFTDQPALCRNRLGEGACYYLSTLPERSWLKSWLGDLARQSGVRFPLDSPVPEGLEATARRVGGDEFLFLLNHRAEAIEVEDAKIRGRELLSGTEVTGRIHLPSRGVGIVTESRR